MNKRFFLALLAAALSAAPVDARLWALRDGDDVVISLDQTCPGVTYDVLRATATSGPWTVIGTTTGSFRDLGAVPGPPVNPPLYFYRYRPQVPPSCPLRLNTVIKINIPLVEDAIAPAGNRVSLPYRYFPDGNLGHWPQTARDLCQANPGVESVERWSADGCYDRRKHLCRYPTAGFDLLPGEGFVVRVSTPATLDLVGAHDDDYAANKAGLNRVDLPACASCPSPGRRLVSVPYHAWAMTAEEVCTEVERSGGDLVAVEEYRPDVDTFVRHPCGTGIDDFPLTAGRAYALEIAADGWWSPDVY